MQFILGVFLFIVVVGIVDARLPWPDYHSRYGHSIENWAIFEDWAISERFSIHQPNSRKVAEDDPDLLGALRILGLIIGD
jgi:hypothetical protein